MPSSSNSKKIIMGIVVGFLVVFLLWYFFIDTLTLSELIGKNVNPKASIFINLFDFDTGLTRYDIYNLKSKSVYWEKRMQEVASITNPKRREIGHEKLMAEMMEDPSMKKIVKKVFGFGTDSVLTVLRAVNAF
ncbi:MAG: hypothetical protein HY999_02695 [Nitrospinae bacterium]|nr:hypothetical protein [Nitrospinota bacterium]